MAALKHTSRLCTAVFTPANSSIPSCLPRPCFRVKSPGCAVGTGMATCTSMTVSDRQYCASMMFLDVKHAMCHSASELSSQAGVDQ